MAIREKLLGDNPETASSNFQLAIVYFTSGEPKRAIAPSERALAISEKIQPRDDLAIASGQHQRATLHLALSEFVQGEMLARRSLETKLRVMPPDDARLAESHEMLAMFSEMQGRYTEALEASRRGLSIREAQTGREDAGVLRLLEMTARNHDYLGRYQEAEEAYREVLVIREKMFGPDHVDTSSALVGLGDAYARQGRQPEAIPLYQRAIALNERAYGKNHFIVTVPMVRLAIQFMRLGRRAEAEALYRQALTVIEATFGAVHIFTAVVVNGLGESLLQQDRAAEAEPILRRGVDIQKKVLGVKHPNVAHSIGSLASALSRIGRSQEAEDLRQRQIEINREAHGTEHDVTAGAYAELAFIQMSAGKFSAAEQNYAVATGIYTRRSAGNLGSLVQGALRAQEGEIGRNSGTFLNHIRALYWSTMQGQAVSRTPTDAEAIKSLDLAQWARLSDAATALARMSARTGTGNEDLARLVREHQDLTAEWRGLESRHSQLLAQGPSAGPAMSPASSRERLVQLEARIAAIGRELQEKFPDYAALSNPRPVALAGIQALLAADEALLQYSLTPSDTFVWAVTREGIVWRRLGIEERDIIAMVANLRKALETRSPFDLTTAHELYKALLAPVEKHVAGKHLLVVPSGVLTSLPFHILVTREPDFSISGEPARYRRAAWLLEQHAVSVLPSISALAALRRQARPSRASEAYLGFGNPLLLGPDGDDRRAWDVTGCPPTGGAVRTAAADARSFALASIGRVQDRNLAGYFRGGAADVAAVRRLEPLPETAQELCAVAASLGSSGQTVVLGAEATESTVKRMSGEGRLAKARVLHFATHGLIAGELRGLAQPALVLTPPKDGATGAELAEDDGLLTASEIADLKLDADWVILSACNTAAGGEVGAEALSGLARAFFYAQARALLVSHWAVASGATVKLIIDAVGISSDQKTGRAQALRLAMRKLIAEGEPYEAHPAYWAPFVLVGEGSIR